MGKWCNCWLAHSWGRWSDPVEGVSFTPVACGRKCWVQERSCAACNARQLREAWNELTFPPLQRWREGPGRNGSAAEALKRRPLTEWREVFRRIGASQKLAAGIGESCWRPDPDWAIRKGSKQKPEPARKVLEGGWDDEPRRWAGPVETAEEIEEANRKNEEFLNG